MQIEIDIPRPIVTLAWILAIAGGIYHLNHYVALKAQVAELTTASSSAVAVVQPAGYDHVVRPLVSQDAQVQNEETVGGATMRQGADASSVQTAAADVRIGQMEQEVIKRKADILRGQLKVLDAELKALGSSVDPELQEQFTQSSRILTALMQDQKRAEEFLLAAFDQLWEAQGRAVALANEDQTQDAPPSLEWPVQPKYGLSATFHDPTYEERFGFRHDAIDVPTEQMTVVHAAADGVVKEVSDHGLGFNSITIQHSGGTVTLYGHISKFLVNVGQLVSAGEPIGYSGGRPGTPGAGLSTGPHLHFGVFIRGMAVDGARLLPKIEGQAASSDQEQ